MNSPAKVLHSYSIVALTLLGALLVLTACSSVQSRIRGDSAYYASLSSQDKDRLRAFEAEPGDPLRLVRLGLGAPSNTGFRDGRLVWVYLNVNVNRTSEFVDGKTRRMIEEDDLVIEFSNDLVVRVAKEKSERHRFRPSTGVVAAPSDR